MQGITVRHEITGEDIRLIVDRHRLLYEKEFGFDPTFGDYVAKTLQGKIDRVWIAEQNGTFAGCIGVVEADVHTAQLRWFLVEPEARGSGLGKALMEVLIHYCEGKGYENIYLWTVNKLPAAKAVYERFGFALAEQKSEDLLWGQKLIEERWDLSLKRNR